MLGVSYDLIETNDRKAAETRVRNVFASSQIGEFTSLLLDAGDLDGIHDFFGVSAGIPQTVAFDRNGEIVDRQAGYAGVPRLALLRRLARTLTGRCHALVLALHLAIKVAERFIENVFEIALITVAART